jgi:gliding motility-associated-like protein
MKAPAVWLCLLIKSSLKLRCIIFLVTILYARLSAQSVGGTTSGAASYCDSVNSGFISLNAFQGQIMYWEFSTNNGGNWTHIINPNSTQSYNNLKQTTSFRAIVKDLSFPEDTSTVSTITVHVPSVVGSMAGGGTFCASSGAGTLILSGFSGTVKFWQYSDNGGTSWVDEQNTQPVHIHADITLNRIYRAVVQTVPGCPADTSAITLFSIQPVTLPGSVTGSDTLCFGSEGDTLKLTGSRGTILGWYFSADPQQGWEPIENMTDTYIYPKVTRTLHYKVAVKNGVCNADTSLPAVVAMYESVPASAGPDLQITRFDEVKLLAKGTGSVSWSNGTLLSDSTILNPVATPLNTDTFVVTIVDPSGCKSSDSMVVFVFVPLPTAITPNGDGVNDFLVIDKLEEYPRNSLKVYNRWGVLVFQASPYKNEWNGKTLLSAELPDDTYYYIFDDGSGGKPAANYILIKR